MENDIAYRELRWHTEYSILIGCGRLDDHLERARELGWDTVCLTETDTMRHTYYIYEALSNFEPLPDGRKVRAIYGCEISICLDMDVKGLSDEARAELALTHEKANDLKKAVWAEERRLGLTRVSRLCLRAMTYQGIKNLYKLTSEAWHRGFFIRPRLDLATLEKYNEGISISIGGTTGLVCDDLLADDMNAALATLERLQETFQGRMWMEIQPHPGDAHGKLNRALLAISRQCDVPLIATNDVHYVREDDTDAHTVILCLARHKTMADPEHPTSPPGYHIRSGQEMYDAFAEHHPRLSSRAVREAIERTVEVAALHTAKLEIDRFKTLVPPVPLDEDETDQSRLTKMCLEGWDWRKMADRIIPEQAKKRGIPYDDLYQTYMDRLKFELSAVKRQKFARYFLVVHDVINWARRQDIMTGPGRGSAAGSMICYLTGITSLDPIEHALMFERFISPNRIDVPDIDMDYEDNRREEVINYLHERYGRDNTCYIGTHGRLRGKAALKDVSRVLDVPMHRVNAVTNSIVERSSGDERASQTVEDSFKEFKVCQDFNDEYPDVLPLVKKLEGCVKSVGVHAAGIIPCPERLDGLIPIERHERHGKWVTITGMDMWGTEAHGLVKLDVLGLRTLSILNDARLKVKERHGINIDFEALELNDQKVLDMFTAGDYVGIFQYDSTGARAACEGIEFTSFEDVAALTALNRPGTMRSGLATEYKKRKQDPRRIKPLHPLVDEICSDTLGVLVYQEQVLKIFIQLAKYEPGTADSLRKKIAKKWGDEALGKERELFVKGATENGMSEADANALMNNITFFGSYGFNKTVSNTSLLRRAGANASATSPYFSINELIAMRDSRDERGRLTPIANKIRYGRFNIIQMDEDGRCRPGRLIAIHNHGIQSTYIITTKDGHKTPPISKSHRLMTEDGYKSIKSGLGIGDKLVFMGNNSAHDYCSWWNQRDGVKGRITDAYRAVSDAVWLRAGGKCEQCETPGERRRGGHEVAHLKTPAECDYNQTLFHHIDNLKLLCNSCHKTLDYAKGERVKAWGKGKPTYLSEVASIDYHGEEQCSDLEMDTPGHNFVAAHPDGSHPPVVSHNSHASAYGVISYWGMWLKKYYPVEFMWALLKNEPERPEIARFAKEAERLGIKTLPPDVNVSGKIFNIDKNNNVRGSLSDLKGVGEAAILAIQESQPFMDIVDFINRVPRKAANSRVVETLIKAGAMTSLLPNTKWSLENLKENQALLATVPEPEPELPLAEGEKRKRPKKINVDGWLEVARKGKVGWEDAILGLVEASKDEPEYSNEDLMFIAGTVSPLGGGKHPMFVYHPMLKENSSNVPWRSMEDSEFWSASQAFIRGVMIEIKYNQVGDFDTVVPGDAEKTKRGWGKRYANINVEDETGFQHRIKVDIDIFEDVRHIIDRGVGTCVAMHVANNPKFHSSRCHYMADLEEMRQKLGMGIPLSPWERCFTDNHPVWDIHQNDIQAKLRDKKGPFIARGLVTSVKQIWTKSKGDKMCFFGLQDGLWNTLDVTVFPNDYEVHADQIKRGNIIKVKVLRDRSNVVMDEVGVLAVLAKLT